MTQTELAEKLGISQGYFSRIYTGGRRPSWKLAQRWKPMTRRTYEWWREAKQADIQRVFNRLLEAKVDAYAALMAPDTTLDYNAWPTWGSNQTQNAAVVLLKDYLDRRRAYAYGLLGYAWLKVLQPAFYAVDKRWLPMMVSILALLLNLAFNWFFVFVMRWGHESLALTTSISATVNFLILFVAMRRFAGDIGELMRRHYVKPGITGLAQISGARGETRTVEDMRRRVNLDLEYLRTWSLWLDVSILARTLVAGWINRHP
jgi:transcriptional regulator with XRE-family HTH domain